jgi:hypothetical protein
MSNPVVGTNSSGNGVTGTGSNYGVVGNSTGAFAGVAGVTSSAAPGVYGQSKSTGPGVLGISGLGSLVDTIVDGNVDAAATQIAGQYPDSAGIFIGSVAITGTLTGNAANFSGAVTASGLTTTGDISVAGITATGKITTSNNVSAKDLTLTGTLTADGNASAKDLTLSGNLTAKGNITAQGNLTAKDVILSGADCAEEFDVSDSENVEPGTVVVFDENGALTASDQAYNPKVAGVISGAGAYRPGVILDRRVTTRNRAPVALVGKVYCKVDANFAPVSVGDLLTTSGTMGFAMKAQDPLKAFGSVIGKALGGLASGQGLIPILVTLK